MNRLRFRVWDKFEKEMLEVHGINYDADGVWTKEVFDEEDTGDFIHFSDIELLQSSGLTDKNIKDIFEGDIVKDTDGNIGYIVFLHKDMGYFIVYKKSDRRLSEVDNYQFEILGNIYEHKYLLWEG